MAPVRILMFAATVLALPPLSLAAEPEVSFEQAPVTGYAIDVEHGEPNKAIDSIGWFLGIPNKLLLWDRRADNHDVSEETVDSAAGYLAANEVDGVMIRVNQYDPLGEWHRLAENKRINPVWRATLGSLYTVGYTIAPGRLLGGDWYNPYTDTVHVYSDVPALAMEQVAQAKDTHDRDHPGLYSAVRVLPLVGLVHEARSKQAVFDHVDEFGTTEERAEARRVLAPQMGTEIGGQAANLFPQGNALLQVGGAVVGHAVGRYKASQIEYEASKEFCNSFPPPNTAIGPGQ